MAERGPNRALDARQAGDNHPGCATSSIFIQSLSSMHLAMLSWQCLWWLSRSMLSICSIEPNFLPDVCLSRILQTRLVSSAGSPNLAVADTLRQFCIATCDRVIVLHQVRHVQLAVEQTHSDALQPNYALPYQAGFQQRWPDMLGSLPYWDGLPKVCLHNGGTCPIIATSSKTCAEIPSASVDLEQCNEYIACLSLLPTPC